MPGTLLKEPLGNELQKHEPDKHEINLRRKDYLEELEIMHSFVFRMILNKLFDGLTLT